MNFFTKNAVFIDENLEKEYLTQKKILMYVTYISILCTLNTYFFILYVSFFKISSVNIILKSGILQSKNYASLEKGWFSFQVRLDNIHSKEFGEYIIHFFLLHIFLYEYIK